MTSSRLRLTAAVLLLPLLIVLGSAWLLLREDEGRRRTRAAATLNALLQEMAARCESAQQDWTRRLETFAAPLLADHGAEALRGALESEPLVRTAAVLDAAGALVFPDPADPSRREKEFLDRSAALLDEPWTPVPPENGRFAETGGWQRFYWRDGVQLLYWKALPEGQGYLLLEVERSALLADLAARLGEAPLPDQTPDRHAVLLEDELGRPFLRWGTAAAAASVPSAAPVESRVALSGALQSWQFRWTAPLAAVPAAADYRLFLGLFLGLAAAASAALTLTLLRRLDREIREAGQRVSFVNQVSHELKTPLTNIRLYAELLERHFAGAAADARETRYLGIILRESARLSRLIHNVLTFARSRTEAADSAGGAAPLHPRLVNPDELARACLDGFRVSLAEKGLELQLDLGCPGPLELDGDAFEQILGNLLSNVEKYARAGGWVGVGTREEGDAVRVEVCDRGPGLPPAFVGRAFKPFERLHSRHTDAAGGAGLGLAIARDLARRHGGEAAYRPREGGGACFYFILRSISDQEAGA